MSGYRFVRSAFCLTAAIVMQQAYAQERWSEERAREWYEARGWLVGANFVPNTAINQLELFPADTLDSESVDRELGWAAALGPRNSTRMFNR